MKKLLILPVLAFFLATPSLAQSAHSNLTGKTLCLGTHLVQILNSPDNAATQSSLNASLTNLLTTKFAAYRIKTLPSGTASCEKNPNDLFVNLLVGVSSSGDGGVQAFFLELRVGDFSGKRFPLAVSVWANDAYGAETTVAARNNDLSTYTAGLVDGFAADWAKSNP